MRGAATRGFVILLLSVPVVQSKNGYGVTYTSAEICAVKGSTVEIHCTYTYPYEKDGQTTTVHQTLWFTKTILYGPVDLKTDSDYAGRVYSRCHKNKCTLTITDLRQSDSAEYKFRFITNHQGGKYSGSPGVTLSVTDLRVQVIRLSHYTDYTWAWLTCQRSCQPDHGSCVWFKNRQEVVGKTFCTLSGYFTSTDSFSCAVRGYERFPSPSVYPPKLPSVSVSPSGDIVEGQSVTLTCSSDANPPANYIWYKDNGGENLSKGAQFILRSIQSSDSGKYFCNADNNLGTKTSEYKHVDVKYPPKLPSVSVSPSAVEGHSVTLTCSSDANPAANYTWYKEDQRVPLGSTGIYHFTSIRSEDRGIYYCKSENKHGQKSSFLSVEVQYPPKLPSVSVSPSVDTVEGHSLTLTCSSDANPAANYTWYKKDEAAPKASGQNFTITETRAEHSGSYYCEAQNSRGRQSSSLHLITVVRETWKLVYIGTASVIFLVVILLLVFLLIRNKRPSKASPESGENPENRQQHLPHDLEEQEDLQYASVHFLKNQKDPIYSSIRAGGPHRYREEEEEEEDVVVQQNTVVKFKSASSAPRTRREETEDPTAL
ncbi:B-cell receptor CD22-like [Parambassis ranga]|uniref:B-cell receptor CD22 n=1 Tax=Parambassis ranga TaxID=210632 RepID=A0A6P7HBI6_9TELE|nr:B-cell receptor CD22-like [Parambassis ranga]